MTNEQRRRLGIFTQALHDFLAEHGGSETEPTVLMAMGSSCLGVGIGALLAHGMSLEAVHELVDVLVREAGVDLSDHAT